MLLPTGQRVVVSVLPGFRKPLQNGRRKLPPHFAVLDLHLHPLQLQVPWTPRPGLHRCLGCILQAGWAGAAGARVGSGGRPVGKNLKPGATGQPLWRT